VAVARTLASALGREGHELVVEARSRAQLSADRRSGRFALMLEFIRSPGNGTPVAHALYPAVDPALGRKAPRLKGSDPRALTRTLPIGIVGELRVSGAHMPELQELSAWDWGECWLRA
jgi:peptide/nickel transport system substrate-binding protein